MNAGEFIAALRALRVWSGLSYRELAAKAQASGASLPPSTITSMLGRTTLPRAALVTTFVHACGLDQDTAAQWAAVRNSIAIGSEQPTSGRPPELPESSSGGGTEQTPADLPVKRRSRLRPVATGLGITLVLAISVAAFLLPGRDSSRHGGVVVAPELPSTPTGAAAVPPNGWVHIRPVGAPHLCLTDGRVRDRRYVPLVAVQRRCDAVAPQGTVLESMGGDLYQIQWHHPDYGKGCLKALSDGPGIGLLEPMDDCSQGSRFHLEPFATYGSNRYVLRVDGQGCVGIRDSDASEGAEAVLERCVGKGGQVFLIEAAS
ncbi:helix-turn-helix domain-containing protein [Micromonospora echinospora]|uniref:helix-turn-helix domain-containing protein n=1 Tax=Micromonospora echinospora TaxID=1877 RepID=UPI003CF3846D